MKTTKYIYISGALGGLGSATVRLLIENNWHVYAGDIDPKILEQYAGNPSVTPMVTDVTLEQSVRDAFDFVTEKSNGLDAVLNMAGVLKTGSVAEVTTEDTKEALDINLFGTYRLNRAFLPLVLKRKGRILTMSSEVGIQTSAPFNGIYSISKHALEAYSDALRRELAFLGIKVIKIQPGPFKTEMTKNIEKLFAEAESDSEYFKNNIKKGMAYLPKVYKHAHDPKEVAKIILKALTARSPKTAYLIKPDLLRLVLDKLPVKWADKIILKALS